ncbi:MAG: EAL domain-containing protein [Pseudomonadaceae bacterium]|nr:MAG: EAL domain-containing protein [Pseudomonadaceae bacterium]
MSQQDGRMQSPGQASIIRFIGIALLTLVAAWLSRFTSVTGDISLIWPVTGISVAVAILWGRLATLAVGLGMVIWAWLQGMAPEIWPLLFAEACIPGLLAWYWPARWTLTSNRALSNLANIYLRGLLPGATGAALFGSLAITASGDFADFHLLDIAAFYWVASAIGVLLITPLLIAVRQQGLRIQRDDWRFLLLWFACLLPVLLIVALANPDYRWIANYLLVPMLVWAGLRAPPLLVNLLLLGVSLLVIAVVRGEVNSNITDNAAMAQVIVQLVVMALTIQVLSAVSRERQSMLRVLERQAHYDQISGLYNELGLAIWLDQHRAKDGTLVILRLEQIDNLVDLLGLEACEEIENSLANEFASHLPGRYARLGRGLYAAALNERMLQVERLLFSFYQRLDGRQASTDQPNLLLRPSMVLMPRSKAGSSDLRLAVEGLAMAANMTGNRFTRLNNAEHASHERLSQKSLQEAIKAGLRDREFMLYAQPIVPLQDQPGGQHCELLLRWKTAKGDVLAPNVFLPAAEQAGLMGSIDRYVIDTLLRMLQQESALTRLFGKFAINLSGSSLADPQLPDWICRKVKAAQIDPALLCFEITESQTISNRAQAAQLVNTLRELGASVSLDDFGTGLATFDYLKQFRFDYLKIDGSFVRELDSSSTDQAIVRAMVSVADTLALQTIAEFVENQPTLELLASLQVDFAQGYHLGRPAPLQDWLKVAETSSS